MRKMKAGESLDIKFDYDLELPGVGKFVRERFVTLKFKKETEFEMAVRNTSRVEAI